MISNRNFIDLDFGREHGIREKAFSPALLHVLDIVNQGYTVVRSTNAMLAKCNAARNAYERFKKRNAQTCAKHADGRGRLPPLTNLHCGLPELISLFSTHLLVTEILDHFLGEAVIFSSTHFEQSTSRKISSDAPYFCTEPEHLHMSVWFALEDMDSNNGALIVVPRAHALPDLDRQKILRQVYQPGAAIDPRSQELWHAYRMELGTQYKLANLEEQEVHAKKGDVVILHPDIPYGEAQALDSLRTRHAFAMQVTPPDMQMGLQDVFYGERKLPAGPASSRYRTAGTRRYVDRHAIGFACDAEYPLSELSF